MKFASKLIPGGQMHLCHTITHFRALEKEKKNKKKKNKQTNTVKLYKAVLKHLPNWPYGNNLAVFTKLKQLCHPPLQSIFYVKLFGTCMNCISLRSEITSWLYPCQNN